MVGKYKLIVYDKKVRYELEVKRKFTLIRGDSACGKTYLRDILMDKGTTVECKCGFTSLPTHKDDYTLILKNRTNSIILVDEDVDELYTKEFSKLLLESDNYFIIFSREDFPSLPISLKEIYTLTSNKRYSNLGKPYTVNTLSINKN